ncbi:hypothetical protein GGF46_004249 [Coemansia sp. RSA 552]|nr:hypothetical protein GGF46_004249 [Coemansia sp. RSA 552]
MAKTFKYDLESLEWDEDHRRNKEGTYCYCGMDYNSGDPMLRCESCEQLFHWDCVSCLKMKPLLGDTFYRFKCSVCAGGSGEEYERETLSWVQVIYLVLYHLIQAEPERKYFRWRENICATINEHWRSLFPGKTKTATWQNTVAGSLSTHSVLFKSGFEDTQQTGNWTLQEAVEPAKAPFKGPTRATGRAAPKRDRPVKKRPRPTGPAAEEILEVLAEGKLDSVKRRGGSRHRVSFSDDEDNEGGSVRRPRAKRSRALENDAELLQSFELFTQLERQRLGDSPDTATKKPDTAAENPDVATKNPDATSTEDGSVRDATVPVSADIAGTSAPANSEVAEGFGKLDARQ